MKKKSISISDLRNSFIQKKHKKEEINESDDDICDLTISEEERNKKKRGKEEKKIKDKFGYSSDEEVYKLDVNKKKSPSVIDFRNPIQSDSKCSVTYISTDSFSYTLLEDKEDLLFTENDSNFIVIERKTGKQVNFSDRYIIGHDPGTRNDARCIFNLFSWKPAKIIKTCFLNALTERDPGDRNLVNNHIDFIDSPEIIKLFELDKNKPFPYCGIEDQATCFFSEGKNMKVKIIEKAAQIAFKKGYECLSAASLKHFYSDYFPIPDKKEAIENNPKLVDLKKWKFFLYSENKKNTVHWAPEFVPPLFINEIAKEKKQDDWLDACWLAKYFAETRFKFIDKSNGEEIFMDNINRSLTGKKSQKPKRRPIKEKKRKEKKQKTK